MDNNVLSDANINQDISENKVKPKTKMEKYVKERKEIVDKIFELINIQTENRIRFFYTDDITDEKQQEIIDMKNKIKKYFIVTGWMSFKTDAKLDKEYMSLIRNILKHEKINYTQSQKMINGVKKTKYILLENNEL